MNHGDKLKFQQTAFSQLMFSLIPSSNLFGYYLDHAAFYIIFFLYSGSLALWDIPGKSWACLWVTRKTWWASWLCGLCPWLSPPVQVLLWCCSTAAEACWCLWWGWAAPSETCWSSMPAQPCCRPPLPSVAQGWGSLQIVCSQNVQGNMQRAVPLKKEVLKIFWEVFQGKIGRMKSVFNCFNLSGEHLPDIIIWRSWPPPPPF